MRLSTEVKQYFKRLNIPVRVNTVAVKRPFVQVWISPANDPRDHHTPLIYTHEFPVELRRNMLKVIYGDDFAEKQILVGCSDSSAGNVKAHSLSFSEDEWRATLAKMSA